MTAPRGPGRAEHRLRLALCAAGLALAAVAASAGLAAIEVAAVAGVFFGASGIASARALMRR